MNERGLPQPVRSDFANLTDAAWEWIVRVWSNYPKVQTFDVALVPTAVNANAESSQTFGVAGLTLMDTVMVNKPTKQAGLSLLDYQVSAVDTLKLTYRNFTGSPITPTAEIYLVTAVRR